MPRAAASNQSIERRDAELGPAGFPGGRREFIFGSPRQEPPGNFLAWNSLSSFKLCAAPCNRLQQGGLLLRRQAEFILAKRVACKRRIEVARMTHERNVTLCLAVATEFFVHGVLIA
jgi:hypothetical protein